MTSTPAEGSVLDRRTLNRTLLLRQGLLARSADASTEAVERTIESLVGFQAQVPRDPYIGLWSRLDGFDPATLEALVLDSRAVRMTLMRTTLHLVTARDAPRLRRATQAMCERAFAGSPFRRSLAASRPTVDLAAVVALGTALLRERPRTVTELGQALAPNWPGADPTALAYAVRYLVPIVQVPPRGLLRRSGAPRLATLDSVLGVDAPSEPAARGWSADPAAGPDADGTGADRSDAAGPDAEALDSAVDAVVLRYLRAFGPATAADVRAWSWLAGVRAVLERLGPRLRRYRDEAGRELWDAADGRFAPPDAPAPARLLGEYDNVFLSHADRTRITGDGAWGTAYARFGTFFVDGFLAGAWRIAREGTRSTLRLDPRTSAAIGRAARADIESEAAALLEFLEPDRSRAVVWATG